MDEVKKEIREALLGDLVPTADGRLAVSFTRIAKYRNGLGDGYDKVVLFGVMCRKRFYLSRKGGKQLHDQIVKGMQDMGRMMWLSSNPDMEAVYCTYLLNNPAILTFIRGKDGVIEITAYSGRGFSGWLACFRTLNKFQKKVPEILQRMSEEDEQSKLNAIREQNRERRILDKQEKKEKKQEKKRLRKEKRKARFEKMTGGLPKLPEMPQFTNSSRTMEQMPRERAEADEAANFVANDGMERLAAEAGFDEQMDSATLERQPQAAGMVLGRQTQIAEVTQEEQVASTAEQEMDIRLAEQATNASEEMSELEALQAEQAKLEAQAEQAKLAARAAQAKLEAARAMLAEKEAQAELAKLEAQLAARTGEGNNERNNMNIGDKNVNNGNNNSKKNNNSGNTGSKKRKKKR